jgi:RND family efflux transporter MFP subunit
MSRRRTVAIVVLAMVATGLLAIRFRRAHQVASESTLLATPVVVETASVRKAGLRETRRFLGEVMAREQPPLAARIMAQVTNVAVREGDRVGAGAVLIELDPREFDDAVVAAEAGLASAREGLAAAEVAFTTQRDASARDRVLVDAGAISREEWDRSEAAQAAAEARREAARAQLTAAERALASARTRRGYATITAPFDGVVANRYVDPGDLASPGRPLLSLLPTSGARIRVKVPSETLPELEVGRTVRCQGDGGPFEARVARIFPAVDGTRLGTFEAEVPPRTPGMVAGATLTVEVGLARPVALVVPRDALLEGEQGAFVFGVAGGRARQVPVRVLARTASEAAVEGALREGEVVAVGRPSRLMLLADGSPVQPAGGQAGR